MLWPGFEELEGPQVLLGHGADAFLHGLVHGRRVFDTVTGREIFQRRPQNDFVPTASRQQAGEARHHHGVGHFRQTPERREGGRGHAKERYKDRLLEPEILVRQIVKRQPLIQPAHHRTQALLARQQLAAEAHAAAVQHPIDRGVALQLDHGELRVLARDHGPAEIHADAVRREQDDVFLFADRLAVVLEMAEVHLVQDALLRRPGEIAEIEIALAAYDEMPAQQAAALARTFFRKAQREIDARDFPALGVCGHHEQAERGADGARPAERQQRAPAQKQAPKFIRPLARGEAVLDGLRRQERERLRCTCGSGFYLAHFDTGLRCVSLIFV